MPPLNGEVTAKQAVGFTDAEFGNFNLWFPISSPEPGGNRWQSALPTGSMWLRALPGGGKWNRATPGNQSARNLADSQKSTAPIYGG